MSTAPKHILIIGRRWFQKSFGNTYHTVDVYVDGEKRFMSPVSYGYDEQYIQTAYDALINAGVVTPERYGNGCMEPLRTLCQRLGITLQKQVSDVTSKRDL